MNLKELEAYSKALLKIKHEQRIKEIKMGDK